MMFYTTFYFLLYEITTCFTDANTCNAPPKLHVWYDAEGSNFSPIERVCVMYNPELQIVETLTERWPVALAHRHFLGALRPLYTLQRNT